MNLAQMHPDVVLALLVGIPIAITIMLGAMCAGIIRRKGYGRSEQLAFFILGAACWVLALPAALLIRPSERPPWDSVRR